LPFYCVNGNVLVKEVKISYDYLGLLSITFYAIGMKKGYTLFVSKEHHPLAILKERSVAKGIGC